MRYLVLAYNSRQRLTLAPSSYMLGHLLLNLNPPGKIRIDILRRLRGFGSNNYLRNYLSSNGNLAPETRVNGVLHGSELRNQGNPLQLPV